MKKFCALLLALGLLLTCFTAAFAEEEKTIAVAAETVQVTDAKAETVTLAVTLADCGGMDSIQLHLNYDQAALRLSRIQAGDLLGSGLHIFNTETSGFVAAAFAWADGVAAKEGTLFTLTFTPVNEAGSAVIISEVLASRYDSASGVQSKAYVTVQDGGIAFGEDAALPAAVITPWPVETPAPTPTPSPIPSPTPEPTAEPTPEPSRGLGNLKIDLGTVIIAGWILAAAAVVVYLVISGRKRRERDRRIDESRFESWDDED